MTTDLERQISFFAPAQAAALTPEAQRAATQKELAALRALAGAVQDFLASDFVEGLVSHYNADDDTEHLQPLRDGLTAAGLYAPPPAGRRP